MREAVICEPLRTPIGRYGGSLREVAAASLAATVIRAVLDRTGIDDKDVDDVLLGQCYPNGEAPAIGRVAALNARMSVAVPGLQVDRRCGSGLQAVLDACMRVQTGVADLVLAGGVESMSRTEHYTLGLRWGVTGSGVELMDRLARGRITAGGHLHPVPGGMLETAENLRREFGITREDQDELALQSHHRAVAAQEDGRFAEEIVPVDVPAARGTTTTVDRDEGTRTETTRAALARLRPVLAAQDPDATVTAGNACGQSDGAAVCVVTHPSRAQALGLRPLVRLVAWGVAGVEPSRMGIGPVPATSVAVERARLTLQDMHLIELNEAFAAQVLAVTRTWGIDATRDDRLNVCGSGISLGHPVGATGARMLTTLARELDRRAGTHGLVTMCIGGGQGLAAVFERIT